LQARRQLLFNPQSLKRALVILVAMISVLGMVAEIAYDLNGRNDLWELRHFTSLSHEENLPTWVASCMLFCCAVLLALIARDSVINHGLNQARPGAAFTRHWYGLAAIFLYISLDETSQIHENWHWIDTDVSVLYFSWVIPAAVITLVIGLAYLRFLFHLPANTRKRVLLAAVLFVGGALGMELPLGYWTDQAGASNLGYGLIDWLEETLELAGTALFLYALALHWLQSPVALALSEATETHLQAGAAPKTD
jgi:hypothetical protein